MKLLLSLAGCGLFLSSCSSLPRPGAALKGSSPVEAKAALQRSAAVHGNPWKNYRKVEVSYDGEWSTLATKIQPIITDPEFRKSSDEIYQPRSGKVRQLHRGPGGMKEVVHTRSAQTEVKFNGKRSDDAEVKAAAALVADAYTVFLFGPSWLLANGKDFSLIPDATFEGDVCQLVVGRVVPGFGNSAEDFFVAWLSKKTGLMRRFQFSLNGMESTAGADVDVEFSEFRTAADGSVWPGQFVEWIQRPILTKAHDWRMTSLTLDGRVVFAAR